MSGGSSLTHLPWRKSSTSGSGNCVEVVIGPDGRVHVRDSKLGEESPILTFAPKDWDNFLAKAREGEFEVEELRTGTA